MEREKMMNACTRDKEISGIDKQARERETEREREREKETRVENGMQERGRKE